MCISSSRCCAPIIQQFVHLFFGILTLHLNRRELKGQNIVVSEPGRNSGTKHDYSKMQLCLFYYNAQKGTPVAGGSPSDPPIDTQMISGLVITEIGLYT